MKRRKARPVNRADFDRKSLISRAQAVRLIAAEVAMLRNTVSKRVGYAVDRGKLVPEAPGHFLFGRLIAWAQDEWPGHFSDWPAMRSVEGDLKLRWDVGDVPIGGQLPPSTMAGWRDLARGLDSENKQLREEIDKLRRKLAREYAKRPREQ
jgi:hypothetical protein